MCLIGSVSITNEPELREKVYLLKYLYRYMNHKNNIFYIEVDNQNGHKCWIQLLLTIQE